SYGANNLSATNNPSNVAGKLGNAVYLARPNSQSLSIADNAALSMGSGVDFTIAALVYPLSSGSQVVFTGVAAVAGQCSYGMSIPSTLKPTIRVSLEG